MLRFSSSEWLLNKEIKIKITKLAIKPGTNAVSGLIEKNMIITPAPTAIELIQTATLPTISHALSMERPRAVAHC